MIVQQRKDKIRNLAYAGRVTLINSVLMGVYSFWANAFILPKAIIKKVEAACRNFLWSADEHYKKQALVSWDLVCRKKSEGGLGIKHFESLNQALMMKHIWDIAGKKDTLWVRWIHNHYLKRTDWWSYKALPDTCWYVKKLVKLTETMRSKGMNCTNGRSYNVQEGYNVLRGNFPKVQWDKHTWGRTIQIKHSFIIWLVWHNRLQVAVRVNRFNPRVSRTCNICGQADETVEHAIFECTVATEIRQHILDWMKVEKQFTSLLSLEKWNNNTNQKIDKEVRKAIFATMVYFTCTQRNSFNFKQPQVNIRGTSDMIKQRVIDRMTYLAMRNRKFGEWNSILYRTD